MENQHFIKNAPKLHNKDARATEYTQCELIKQGQGQTALNVINHECKFPKLCG